MHCLIMTYIVGIRNILTGGSRSHIDAFKRVRDARIDRYVVETNKVLIRLDKLISPDAPTDPGKRKGVFFFLIIFVDKKSFVTF